MTTLEAIALTQAVDGTADKLFIGLHGWGANAQDLVALSQYLPLAGYQLHFPNAPFPHPYNPVGRMWYGLSDRYDFGTYPDVSQDADLQTSRQALRTWITTVTQETQIPLARTLLAGFSQGGAMALDVGLQLPLAGIIVLSGYLHSPPAPHSDVGAVLMIHGQSDSVVPVHAAHRVRTVLQAHNLDLTYEEFEMGHEIGPAALQRVAAFCHRLEDKF